MFMPFLCVLPTEAGRGSPIHSQKPVINGWERPCGCWELNPVSSGRAVSALNHVSSPFFFLPLPLLLLLPVPSLSFLFIFFHFLAPVFFYVSSHFINSSSVLIHAYSFCPSIFCSLSSMSIQPCPLFFMMYYCFMDYSNFTYYIQISYLRPLVSTF